MINKLKHFVLNFLWQFVGVYDDKLYRISYSSGRLSLIEVDEQSDSSKIKIWLVSPKYVFQMHQMLPTETYRESIKIANNLVFDAPFSGTQFKSIKQADNKYVVNGYIVDTSAVDEKIKDAWFILPLTVVLAKVGKAVGRYSLNTSSFFIASVNGHTHQYVLNDNYNSSHWFWENGLEPGSEQVYDEPSTLNIIKDNIYKIDAFEWKEAFSVTSVKREHDFDLSKFLITLGVALGLYISISSVYLIVVLQSQERDLVAINKEIPQALETKKTYQADYQRLEQLVELVSETPSTAGAWAGVLEAMSYGASINKVEITENEVTIDGFVNSATGLLQYMIESAAVNDAKFIAPTRKQRGSEKFRISWKIPDTEAAINE